MWGSRISPMLIFWKQDPLVLLGVGRVIHLWKETQRTTCYTKNHHHTLMVSSNFMCFMWNIALGNILYFGSRDPGKGAISTLHELANVATHGILHRFAADSIARGPTATFSLSAGFLVRGSGSAPAPWDLPAPLCIYGFGSWPSWKSRSLFSDSICGLGVRESQLLYLLAGCLDKLLSPLRLSLLIGELKIVPTKFVMTVVGV